MRATSTGAGFDSRSCAKQVLSYREQSGIEAKHVDRLRLILSNLDQAESAEHMDFPGLSLHKLKGQLRGIWAVKVSANWRVTFRFAEGNADIVNYEDYH